MSMKDAVDNLFAVINRIKDMNNIIVDIVQIVDNAGLGSIIPGQLRQYRNNDFNYDAHVRFTLTEIIKQGGRGLEFFLKELNKSISKYNCCERFEVKKCDLPKTDFSDEPCSECSKFSDNGVKDLFERALRLLGYSLDEEGFVVKAQRLDVESELAKIAQEASMDAVKRVNIDEVLPKDIVNKAKDMAEVYAYVYCIENSLRLFIKKVCSNVYGDDYLNKINISNDIKTKITRRKNEAKKNKWLTVRGDEDLFYIDIEDLGRIVMNNWNLFKDYFPEQNWITQKIKEIQDMRNPIAHNCYIGETERNLLNAYYSQILRQIAGNLSVEHDDTDNYDIL